MTRTSLNFIELFAGAGLLSHAFMTEGFSPLLAVELDAAACNSYRTNVGEHVVQADVTQIAAYRRCDLLVAGPPCQGFSTLNRNRSFDERNQLSLSIATWASRCRPKLVVVENVAPFSQSAICGQLIQRLETLGYTVDLHVIDASEHGVPQRRKRTFLFASRGNMRVVIPRRKRKVTTLRDAWSKLPDPGDDPLGGQYPQPSQLALSRFKKIPPGGDRRDIMRTAPELAPPSWAKLKSYDNTGVWGRLVWDQPAPTLRTEFQNPSKGRHVHPDLNRVISIREGARIQTVPDAWQFVGARSQIARQIGNGVPVALGKLIAKACYKALT